MATTHPPDPSRRIWITATSIAGGAGLAATAVLFIASMAPSERARALGAPVKVDLSGLAPGSIMTVEWRGQPVLVLHRSPEMLAALKGHDDELADPASLRSTQPEKAANAHRSIQPNFLLLLGICTHLGCVPSFRPNAGAADIGATWPGGFYCPCHGSKFDLAGRVFKNVPAPTNLVVPPHHFTSSSVVLVGTAAKT